MDAGFSVGYLNFTILLLLFSGGGMLLYDVKMYRQKKLDKEKKAAQILGWFNLSLGVLTFIGNWIYQQLIW